MTEPIRASGETVARVAWQDAPWTPRAWQAAALPVVVEHLRAGRRSVVSAVMGAGKSVLQAELCWLALPKTGDRAIVITAPKQALVRQLAETIRRRCGADAVGTFYANSKQDDRPIVVACNASADKLAARFALAGRRVALMVCDEAHGTEGERIKSAIDAMAPAALVGFTATPFRSAESERLQLFDVVAYRYTIVDATRDRVLVPMRHVAWEGQDTPLIDDACVHMIETEGTGPGIVSANTIEDAERFAAHLVGHGIQAEAIHSRHKRAEQADKLERLRAGGLAALVHVALLSEGVDLPWLRWICLRRPVEAKVRFLQELGRVLRIDPEPREDLGPKLDGIVIDPHLLLGRHGLTSTEAIGAALDELAEDEEEKPSAERQEGEPGPAELPRVVAWQKLSRHLAELHAAMLASGMIKRHRVWTGSRSELATERQKTAIGRLSWATGAIPATYRGPVRTLFELQHALTKKQASDLLDVLGASADYRRRNKSEDVQSYMIRWDANAINLEPLPVEDYAPIKRLAAKLQRKRTKGAS